MSVTTLIWIQNAKVYAQMVVYPRHDKTEVGNIFLL